MNTTFSEIESSDISSNAAAPADLLVCFGSWAKSINRSTSPAIPLAIQNVMLTEKRTKTLPSEGDTNEIMNRISCHLFDGRQGSEVKSDLSDVVLEHSASSANEEKCDIFRQPTLRLLDTSCDNLQFQQLSAGKSFNENRQTRNLICHNKEARSAAFEIGTLDNNASKRGGSTLTDSPIFIDTKKGGSTSSKGEDELSKSSLPCKYQRSAGEAAPQNSKKRKKLAPNGMRPPSCCVLASETQSTLEPANMKAQNLTACSMPVAHLPPSDRLHLNESNGKESSPNKKQKCRLERQFSNSIENMQLQYLQSTEPNKGTSGRKVDQTGKQRTDYVIALTNITPDSSLDVNGRDTSESATDQNDDAIRQRGEVKQPRFRDYQEKNWAEMYERLLEFREENGHCNVPTSHKIKTFARWVKRQRYQYSLLLDDKQKTTLTPERVKALEKIGFVWDPQSEAWNQHFKELKLFKRRHGHTNVPVNCKENPSLGVWVKSQRRQYVLQQEGRPTFMSPNRFELLESLGMKWEARSRSKKTSQSQP